LIFLKKVNIKAQYPSGIEPYFSLACPVHPSNLLMPTVLSDF